MPFNFGRPEFFQEMILRFSAPMLPPRVFKYHPCQRRAGSGTVSSKPEACRIFLSARTNVDSRRLSHARPSRLTTVRAAYPIRKERAS